MLANEVSSAGIFFFFPTDRVSSLEVLALGFAQL